MIKARERISKQVDIIKMIQTSRFVELALKSLIEPQLRKDLKKRSKFEEVDLKAKKVVTER